MPGEAAWIQIYTAHSTCPLGAHCLPRERGMQINSYDLIGQCGQIEEVLNPIWWEMKGIQDEESRDRKVLQSIATCSES